ncbi:MAG: magnesium/cobalt transporter CorA [Planctomycetes bacterium]|nr:magnesium/cobalt transporter CorA [Planctomycetota bacterium]
MSRTLPLLLFPPSNPKLETRNPKLETAMLTILHVPPGETQLVQESDPARLSTLLSRKGGFTWIDLFAPNETEASILTEVFHFHPLAIDDCFDNVHHPKVEDYGDYLFIVVHGIVATDLTKEALKTEELDIFLGDAHVVTFHKEPRRSVAKVRERVLSMPGLLAKGGDSLVYELLQQVVEDYMPTLQQLEDAIEEVEDHIFKSNREDLLQDVLAFKKDVMHLRRIILPQREVALRLSRGEFKRISAGMGIFFRDIYDQFYRVADMTESYRDVVSSVLEAHLTVTSNRMNSIMKVLTIFSSIMLPLSLIAGIYGMNVQLPGEPVSADFDGGSTFWWIIGGMSAITLTLLGLFRRSKWI